MEARGRIADNDIFVNIGRRQRFDKISMENVRGNELHWTNDDDLHYFGILDQQDRDDLMRHIKRLTDGELERQLLPPPIAFGEYQKMMPIKQRSMGDEPLMPQHSIEGILNHISNKLY